MPKDGSAMHPGASHCAAGVSARLDLSTENAKDVLINDLAIGNVLTETDEMLEMGRTFLGQIAKVLNKDSRLLIHDTLMDDLHPEQYDTRADFVMMSLFGGMERSQQQMRTLLQSVGLTVTGSYKPGPEQWTITEAMLP
ncbi:O-methyltransferase gsfD [Fulvia fulva]|uniref:O-methyltransferase gsfD n=1 Tax=Passalora fulva TaxID=5499 RepID=A0A9Q8USJ2_PASFU|nr:O-methyltransferase gsfD [Fulvia fulva]KAK4618350.1 O-methyltransferase gsfD [Fulvia fulva]KAK4619153.1 O-methyltransferase gsfD [Fulvia fulva]UJO20858.1 O-methyltransferase gsfD [Fulvia fulva]WPV18597.1 O-methyltransferase gsfD [Fulvia fulva]WPV33072.1 O-methyltransferase gsfD [Fulvia fulva]